MTNSTKVRLGLLVAGTIVAGVTVINSLMRTTREKIVDVAMTQIGEQNPDTYWQVVQPVLVGTGAAWCGGFALWALKQVGLLPDLDWAVGRGFIFRGNNGAELPRTSEPKPGDIAYFQNLQHHAIVKSWNPTTNELVTIDGNQSPGEQVKLRTRNAREATAFFSIEPLLS